MPAVNTGEGPVIAMGHGTALGFFTYSACKDMAALLRRSSIFAVHILPVLINTLEIDVNGDRHFSGGVFDNAYEARCGLIIIVACGQICAKIILHLKSQTCVGLTFQLYTAVAFFNSLLIPLICKSLTACDDIECHILV